MSEHAILLDWDHEPELAVVFEIEEEIGSGTVRIIAPTVTILADPPATVTLRPGGPGPPAHCDRISAEGTCQPTDDTPPGIGARRQHVNIGALQAFSPRRVTVVPPRKLCKGQG